MNGTELAAALGTSIATVYRWEAAGPRDSGCRGALLFALQAIGDAVGKTSGERVAAKLRQGLRSVVFYALTK